MAKSKREIDKELMYKKLMPSAPKAKSAKETEEEAAPEPGRPSGEAPVTAREEPVSRAAGPRKVSVPSLDNHKTVVVNTMESLVLGKLGSVLSRFQCCRCDRCKKDIVALALNKLPAKYRVFPESTIPPDIDPQLNAQIVTALIQAVIQVRAKPRH